MKFVTASSAALECNDALYANISYPLASTLCSDASHASVTVTKHLARLALEIDQAESKLKELSQDFEACLEAEDQTWAQLDTGAFLQSHAADTRDSSGAHAAAAFRDKVHDIVTGKSKMLEDIEEVVRFLVVRSLKVDTNGPQEYQGKCQAETEKILRRLRGRE